MPSINGFPILTPEEAVAEMKHGETVSFSGFTPAGAAKVVPQALAARARNEHEAGRPFKVRVLTGASSGHVIDDELARADSVAWRAPYQSGAAMRRQINDGSVEYVDMHLSHVPQTVQFGFFGRIDMAVVEATEVTADGRVFLTTSIGASPTYLQCAERGGDRNQPAPLAAIAGDGRYPDPAPSAAPDADSDLRPAGPDRVPLRRGRPAQDRRGGGKRRLWTTWPPSAPRMKTGGASPNMWWSF